MSQYVLHKAETRGHFDHGWLNTYHTFSFSGYYHPDRENFGVLRVLNDDVVAAGRGFPSHSHEEMEIVSIPLSGELEHKDSTGSRSVIKTGEVQHMSAGTGIVHSEYNPSNDRAVNFLQIWVLPKKRRVEPAYHQKQFDPAGRSNTFLTVVAPEDEPHDGALPVNQDAYFSLIRMDKEFHTQYQVKRKENGVYIFVLEGEVTVDERSLSRRDGLGVWDTAKVDIQAAAAADAELLLIDIPMNLR
jgi:redox-sensitive bicupin YhaK (pirin superfamily)